MPRAYVYGDSLLKATVPDEQFHYHFHLPEVMERYSGRQTEVVSRAKMGATIRKGQALLDHDLQRGLQADFALIAYGGNDRTSTGMPFRSVRRRSTFPVRPCRSFEAPCFPCCKSFGTRACSRC